MHVNVDGCHLPILTADVPAAKIGVWSWKGRASPAFFCFAACKIGQGKASFK
jgi:hypothetical protein